MTLRQVDKIVEGRNTQDGAGVKLVRVLGPATVKDFDPFLMLDAFQSTNPEDYTKGFPLHPHRGIETVTYLVKGLIEHKDSLGNKGAISDGSCQWMTAGSGIMHEEMPRAVPEMLGLQLWVNLPADKKMTEPRYNDLQKKDIPVIKEESGEVRVLSGEYKGTKARMQGDFVKVSFLDLRLKAQQDWEWEVPKDATLFSYVFSGEIMPAGDNEWLPEKRAILFTQGDKLKLSSGADGAHLVLLCAQPLKEPVAWGGPIVMNTEEELKEAYFDLENETFIKSKISI